MAKSLGLNKLERLKSKKVFSELFSSGSSLFVYPIKLIYIQGHIENPYPAQFSCVASKRNFKKATDRNHIKRHLREAYRLNKPALYDGLNRSQQQVALLYIYVSKDRKDLIGLEKSITKVNKLLLKKLANQ